MICLFCNQEYDYCQDDSKDADGVCGTCVAILSKQSPEILEGAYAKAVRKNATNQATALVMFIGKERAYKIKQEVEKDVRRESEDRQLSERAVCDGSVSDGRRTPEVSEEQGSSVRVPVRPVPGLSRKRTLRVHARQNQKRN